MSVDGAPMRVKSVGANLVILERLQGQRLVRRDARELNEEGVGNDSDE